MTVGAATTASSSTRWIVATEPATARAATAIDPNTPARDGTAAAASAAASRRPPRPRPTTAPHPPSMRRRPPTQSRRRSRPTSRRPQPSTPAGPHQEPGADDEQHDHRRTEDRAGHAAQGHERAERQDADGDDERCARHGRRCRRSASARPGRQRRPARRPPGSLRSAGRPARAPAGGRRRPRRHRRRARRCRTAARRRRERGGSRRRRTRTGGPSPRPGRGTRRAAGEPGGRGRPGGRRRPGRREPCSTPSPRTTPGDENRFARLSYPSCDVDRVRPSARHPPPPSLRAGRLAAPPAEQGPSAGMGWQSPARARQPRGDRVRRHQPATDHLLAGGLFAIAGIGGAVAMALEPPRSLAPARPPAARSTSTTSRRRQRRRRRRPKPSGRRSVAHPAPRALVTSRRHAGGSWERRLHDADFLDVRIGLGDDASPPARAVADPEPLTVLDPVLVAAGEMCWPAPPPSRDVPVSVDLGGRRRGSGSRRSRPGRAPRPRRSSVSSPRCTRLPTSPSWTHADGDRRWSWVAWLPHAGGDLAPRRSCGSSTAPDGTRLDGRASVAGRGGRLRHRAPSMTVGADARARRSDAPGGRARRAVRDGGRCPRPCPGSARRRRRSRADRRAGRCHLGLRRPAPAARHSTTDRASTGRPRRGTIEHVLRVPFGVDERRRAVVLDLKEAALGGVGPARSDGRGHRLGQERGAAHDGARPGRAAPAGAGQLRARRLQGRRRVRRPVRAAARRRADHQPRRRHGARRPDARRPVRRAAPPPRAAAGRRQPRLGLGVPGSARRRPRARARCPTSSSSSTSSASCSSAKPEFIELFNAIGRLGRSLGIHLLFASQRLDEGRLRGLESHLSYRIALRTFSAAESRTVIGSDDAFKLPTMPGVGLLAEPDGRAALPGGDVVEAVPAADGATDAGLRRRRSSRGCWPIPSGRRTGRRPDRWRTSEAIGRRARRARAIGSWTLARRQRTPCGCRRCRRR